MGALCMLHCAQVASSSGKWRQRRIGHCHPFGGPQPFRPLLAGIQPLAARGNRYKKLKSIGVAGVAEGMDVLAVATATEAAVIALSIGV